MKIALAFMLGLLAVQPVMAEPSGIERLERRIKALEAEVVELSARLAEAESVDAGTGAAVSVPQDRDSPPPDDLILLVTDDGRTHLDGERLDEDTLTKRLEEAAAQHPDRTLIIRADAAVKFRELVRLLGLCREAGIEQIAFGTYKARPRAGDQEESDNG